VVFDSWVDYLTLAGLDENSATDLTSWVHALAGAAKRRGAAVLLLDHVPTDANRSRGSTQNLGKVDVSWQLKKVLPFDRHTVGQIQLRLEKDREGHLPKRVQLAIGSKDGFVFRREAQVYEKSDPAHDLTNSQKRILDYIEERGKKGARFKDIKDDTGLSKSTISGGLRKLVSSNLVTKDGNPYYPVSCTKPQITASKANPNDSEEFDFGSVEPPEPGTSREGSGGSVTFRDRTTEPSATCEK
jgi:MarR family